MPKEKVLFFFGIIVLWNCKLAYKDSNWIQAFQGFLPPNFGVIYFCWLENWRAWKNIESGCCWGTSRWRPWWRKRWTKRRQRLGSLHLNPLHPLHQYAYSPHCSLFISYGADKENLFNNQELPKLLIISFILVTLMCDLGVISMEKLNAGHS